MEINGGGDRTTRQKYLLNDYVSLCICNRWRGYRCRLFSNFTWIYLKNKIKQVAILCVWINSHAALAKRIIKQMYLEVITVNLSTQRFYKVILEEKKEKEMTSKGYLKWNRTFNIKKDKDNL